MADTANANQRPRRPAPKGSRRADRPVLDLADPDPDPDPTTGTPEAIVEQHELWMEREPWAKYTGALAGARIATALALRAKRKAAGAVLALWGAAWLVRTVGS